MASGWWVVIKTGAMMCLSGHNDFETERLLGSATPGSPRF